MIQLIMAAVRNELLDHLGSMVISALTPNFIVSYGYR